MSELDINSFESGSKKRIIIGHLTQEVIDFLNLNILPMQYCFMG